MKVKIEEEAKVEAVQVVDRGSGCREILHVDKEGTITNLTTKPAKRTRSRRRANHNV